MDNPPSTTQKRPSRLLAILDGEELPFLDSPPSSEVPSVTPQPGGGTKRPHDSLEDAVSLLHPGNEEDQRGNKRRASGSGILEEQPTSTSDSGLTGGSRAIDEILATQRARFVEKVAMTGSPARLGLRIRYDEDTIHGVDRGGPNQPQCMADFVARSIDNASHGLTVAQAMEHLNLKDKRDLLPGLEVRLLPHQAIGVSWMVKQEKGPSKGGILADDMGLGKTVQMIAAMSINQPRLNENARTTLIVVPAALLLQWKEEIETKSNDIFTVHIHHGKDKLKKPADFDAYDVVITSYGTLTTDCTIPSDVEPEEELRWLRRHGGPISRNDWYRIVADEAQFIRNRATRSSKSLAILKSKYRWCLTGTPVTNNLVDIYGLIRFGHFRPWNDWSDFNEHIGKVQLQDAPLAGMRAQQILKPLLLRRTKDGQLEGKPLLELPEKHIDLVHIEFSEEERQLYDQFEKRAQISINKFIRDNTIVKNHTAVLVMILRLRQLCGHPNLILGQFEESEDPTILVASEQEKELARATKAMGALWVVNIKQKFLQRAIAARFDYEDDPDSEEASCPVCGDFFVNNGRLLACGHEICFDCMMDLNNSPIAHNGIFGEGDEQANLRNEKEYEAAAAKGLRPCPTCKTMNDLGPNHTFLSKFFEPTSQEFKDATRRKPKRPQAPKNVPVVAPKVETPQKRSYTSKDIDDILDMSESSDEEFPDMKTLLKKRHSSPAVPSPGPKRGKKAKKEEDVKVKIDFSDEEPRASKGKKGKGVKGAKKEAEDVKKVDSSDEESETDTLDIPVRTSRQRQLSRNIGANTSTARTAAPGKAGPSSDLINTWRRGDDDLEPSAKMVAMVEFLKEWEALGDKTIVYSQWTSMLDLVEILFARHGIQSLRYDGKMNREARESVLAQFRKTTGPKVILISTKCGGVGLNLVSANRVINLDLSWNYASESQAYDRVHRLGQEKEVFVKRLVVKDTIEDRMLRLQDTKTGLAEVALGEGGGIKLHKLSVKELRALFGMKTPEQGGGRGRCPATA